jgi:hypothetical protein
MSQRPRLADPVHHRAYVKALVLRAGELERRAAVRADEIYRRTDSLRDASGGAPSILKAIDTLVAATGEILAAAERMHLAMVRVADEEPQWTRWQRWRVRRMLTKAIASMERGVVDLENHR